MRESAVGCVRAGDYREVFGWNTEIEDQSGGPDLEESDYNIRIGVLERANSTVRSVCIYPSKNVKCTRTKCNRKPNECADLSEWEKAEKAAAKP
jgi:hypothetical protein